MPAAAPWTPPPRRRATPPPRAGRGRTCWHHGCNEPVISNPKAPSPPRGAARAGQRDSPVLAFTVLLMKVCIFHSRMGTEIGSALRAAHPELDIEVVTDTERDPPCAGELEVLVANTFPPGMLG